MRNNCTMQVHLELCFISFPAELHCDLNMKNLELFLPSGSPHGAIFLTGQQEHIVPSDSLHIFLVLSYCVMFV